MATKKEVPTMVDVLGGEYVTFKEWVGHRRSKNYIARLVGTHPKFKFNRQFFNYTTIDGKACYKKNQFEEGGIYEIKFIYFTGSGYPEPTIDGIFKFNGAEFEPITEEQAMELFGKNINDLFHRRAAIIDMLDEADHVYTGIEYPGRGFHSLYEAQFETADGYTVHWAWVISGDGDGIKYTVAVAANKDEEFKTGWERGHKSYVLERPVPREFTNAIRHLAPGKLFMIGELPGFDTEGNHRDGWFSKGLFAIKLPVPDCLTVAVECADPELVLQPECWRIKEGVFIVFPDDTYRLMGFMDYLTIRRWERPMYRQGDLMFFGLQWSIEFDDNGEPIPPLGYTFDVYPEGYSVDRHGVDGLVLVRKSNAEGIYERDIFLVGPAVARHPEHGTLEIPEGQYEIAMLPGTSRPFRSGGRLD